MNDPDLAYITDVDLGDDHYLRYFRWAPDDLLVNRALYGTPLPRVEKAGAIVRHRCDTETGWCESTVHFDLLETARMSGSKWQVESWEPLTLSPSLLCRSCGDHGFVREGKWVKA